MIHASDKNQRFVRGVYHVHSVVNKVECLEFLHLMVN